MKLRQFLPKNFYKKCLLIIGLLLIIAGLYILSFIFGKPVIDTDYVAQLNQLNKPENYNPEDNAWPYYKKAFELYSEPNTIKASQTIISHEVFQKNISDFNDAEISIVMQWIKQNQPAWQQFIIASTKSDCLIEYTLREPDSNEYFLRFVQELNVPTMKINVQVDDLRNLFLLGRWRLKLEVENDNTNQAIEDSFTFLRSSFHWQKKQFLSTGVFGLHFISIGNENLLELIHKTELSINELEDIQTQLTDIYKLHSIELDFTCEKFSFMDLVQHVFTKGIIGGGHIIPKYLPALVQMSSVIISMSELKTDPTLIDKSIFLTISMLHIRRNKTIKVYNEMLAETQKMFQLTPYERKHSSYKSELKSPYIFNFKVKFNSFVKQSRYFLVSISKPASERMADIIYMKKTEFEATITILALKRYFLVNGSYPENLQELLDKGYITKLPMDPYSDKSLVYKKVDDDFTLYSLGEDFEDNNGTPLFSGEYLQKWGDSNSKTGGDAVFWPVPKYNKELTQK